MLRVDGNKRNILGESIKGLRCAAEIDLVRAAANYNLCKSYNKKIIAVVKADAYGHGAKRFSQTLQDEGCTSFAVSNLDEGAELRYAGITGEIICLGYVADRDFDELKRNDITPIVYDLSSYKNAVTHSCDCYLKIDTGMHRLGFVPGDKNLLNIAKEGRINIIGAMTHFSVADSLSPTDIQFTDRQIDKFLEVANGLKKFFPDMKMYAANSAAAITHPNLFDGARCGIALYGVNPSNGVTIDGILPVMTLKAVVSTIKTINTNEFISYGRTFKAQKNMKTAVVTAGYGDGYRRAMSNCGRVLINNKYAFVLGRVTMDQTIVDVSDIDCKVGDEVILFGDGLPVNEMAQVADTIPYEILCGISKRVPRIYKCK